MKNTTLFLTSAALTFCVFYTGSLLTAEPATVLAGSPVAVIGKVDIEGKLVQKDDGVYAQFALTNPSDKSMPVSFHYAARCTPASSMMSRMGPVAFDIKNEEVKEFIIASGKTTKEFLVQKRARPVKTTDTDIDKNKNLLVMMTPESWSLLVSPKPIPAGKLSSALLPAVLKNKVKLTEGEAVLSSLEFESYGQNGSKSQSGV